MIIVPHDKRTIIVISDQQKMKATQVCSTDDPHSKKSSDSAVPILKHASEQLVPAYEKSLSDLEHIKSDIDSSAKSLADSLHSTRDDLGKIRDRLQTMVDGISKALESFDDEDAVSALASRYSSITASARQKLKSLKTALAAGNAESILSKVCEPVSFGDLQKEEAQTFDSVRKALSKSAEFETSLAEGLKEVTALSQRLSAEGRALAMESDTRSFVYGVCKPAGEDWKQLCRYDIATRKITRAAVVPEQCSVLQVGTRVFVSGGYDPVTNSASEVVGLELKPLQNMAVPKCAHRMVLLTPDTFATVGGFDGEQAIKHCEEYDIQADKWTALPSLNHARDYVAAVTLGKILYAIGGNNSGGSVEMLDLREKKAWMQIALADGGSSLDEAMVGFAVSSHEIMLLGCGMVYDVKTRKMLKQEEKATEYYTHHAVCTVRGNVYVLGGDKGNVRVYTPQEKRVEEVEFAAAYQK